MEKLFSRTLANPLISSNIPYWIVGYIGRGMVSRRSLPMRSLAMISTLYHLNHEKRFEKEDLLAAYLVITTNIYLYLQSYTSFLSMIGAVLALSSLFIFWRQGEGNYRRRHSIRHLLTALATLLIYMGYGSF